MTIKSLTTLACGLLLALTSCDKIEKATRQDVSITPTSVSFSIDKINTTSELSNVGSFEVALNLDSLVKKNVSGFSASNIKSIKLTSFRIELSNADAVNNFGAFESVKAQIEANGQSPVELVSVTNNPDIYSQSITIPVTGGGVDLKNYLNGTFKYSVTGKARRVTTKVLNAKAIASYTFTVGF